MTVHSSLLYGGGPHGPTSVTVYTTPSTKRTILKGVVVYNDAAAASRITIYLYDGTTIAALLNYHLAASGSAGDTEIDLPWAVVPYGYHLEVYATQTGAYFWLSGAELDL